MAATHYFSYVILLAQLGASIDASCWSQQRKIYHMSRDWESVFTTWAQGPSKTEQEKAENAERQIRQAIQASPKLQNRDIRVFTQGSYRNRVNVRRDSDVDIGVVCFDAFFPHYPDDNVKAQINKSYSDGTYTYLTFKSELEEALVARFGRDAVKRGS